MGYFARQLYIAVGPGFLLPGPTPDLLSFLVTANERSFLDAAEAPDGVIFGLASECLRVSPVSAPAYFNQVGGSQMPNLCKTCRLSKRKYNRHLTHQHGLTASYSDLFSRPGHNIDDNVLVAANKTLHEDGFAELDIVGADSKNHLLTVGKDSKELQFRNADNFD